MSVGTLLFSSREHLAGKERSAPSSRWEAAGQMVVSHPDVQGHFFGAARTRSWLGVLVVWGPLRGPQGRTRAQPPLGARGAQAKPRGGVQSSSALGEALLGLWVAGGSRARTSTSRFRCQQEVSRAWALPAWSSAHDTEGLDLFLRQSCILILDVLPEAYFS